MNKVQEIEAAIERLKPSPEELRQIRDWLDEALEEDMEVAPAFQAKIDRSLRDMAEGKSTRTRRGPDA